MTKKDYLRALKNEIQALPLNEQKEALDYYENYFLDAGVENEQKVIDELGDVKKLASDILSNVAGLPQKKEAQNKDTTTKKEISTTNKWLIAIIVVLTFPVWIHIVGLLFGLIASILAIGFSGIIVAIALFVGAIGSVVAGVWAITTTPLVAIFLFGLFFVLVGIGILSWILGLWFFSKFIPWAWKGLKNLWLTVSAKIKSKI